jgi:hypothetical protein
LFSVTAIRPPRSAHLVREDRCPVIAGPNLQTGTSHGLWISRCEWSPGRYGEQTEEEV